MRYHPFRHLGLKVLAIALASLLWLTVAGEHVVERSLRVPLEFRNIPPRRSRSSAIRPTRVDVRLRGSSAVLSRARAAARSSPCSTSARRGRGRGSSTCATTKSARRTASRSRRSIPGTLALELEKSARRTVPVVPALDGEPAPGFVVGRVTSDPADGRGRRAREPRCGSSTEATTEPVAVNGQPRRGSATSSRSASPTRRSGWSSRRARTVTVEILPAPVERELPDVPVRWRNLGAGLRAQVSAAARRG